MSARLPDFAKEARLDLKRSGLPEINGLYLTVETYGRRMYAEGVREGMAKAAEIARAENPLTAVNEAQRWPEPPRYDERWVKAVCAAAELMQRQIAEAILAAAPPKES